SRHESCPPRSLSGLPSTFCMNTILRGRRRAAGRLADFDQVPVRVPDVGTNLYPMIFGLGQEFHALRRPVLVDLLDVGHPDVEERARAVRVWWRGQGHGRFVVGRPATFVEDEPGIRYLHDHRVARDQDLPSENLLIE